MSKLLHLKASRTQILNTFPANTFGKDGDIVISTISGKGVYLCSKANGQWYTANKMEELRKSGQISTNKINTNKLSINRLVNSTKNNDKFIVSEDSVLVYRTTEQVIDDLDIKIRNIDYKTAYCSLGQYEDKDSCEQAGGTWYYSENDSHDSVSSTAENQLLTVGQSIGNLDAEPTLLYDGSTLEIKRNTNYDDNWQTSTQTNLLKLIYDSTNYFQIDVDADGATTLLIADSDGAEGHLTLDPDGDLIITTDHNTGQVTIDKNSTNTATATNTAMQIDLDHTGISASGQTISNVGLDLDMNCESVTHIGTVNQTGIDVSLVAATDGTQVNIGIKTNVSGGDKNYDIMLSHDATNYCTFETRADGATTIATTDSDGVAGQLTLDIDGSIELNAASGTISFKKSLLTLCTMTQGIFDYHYDASNYLRASISSAGVTTLTTIGGTAADADFIVDAGGDIALDSGTGVFIAKAAGTEFSASNSAYAGMMLGYTQVGGDVADDSYALTTSYIVFESDMNVVFKTPPSEKVEIQATFTYVQGAGGVNVFASISDNATYTSNSLHHDSQHEKAVTVGSCRGGTGTTTMSWYLNANGLEAIGASNTLYFAAKCSNTSGTPTLYWGGDATDDYQNFVIRAIALPA